MELYFHQKILQEELSKRVRKNPLYSQRSFAKFLEIDCGTYSKIVRGMKSLSYAKAHHISQKLEMTEQKTLKFMLSLAHHQRDLGLKRKDRSLKDLYDQHEKRFKRLKGKRNKKELDTESFRIIADWYHFAILQLAESGHLKFDLTSISSRLGITPTNAKIAIDRLISLGYLANEKGILVRKTEQLRTFDRSKTTKAHRQRQAQLLELSKQSLLNDDISIRNHSASTMLIDPSLIPEAKEKISAFIGELSDFLESKKKRKVYELIINLFPLEKGK